MSTAYITPAPLSGSIRAIASKSVAHRLLICAALSGAKTRVVCPTSSQDIDATVACLQALGCTVQADGQGFSLDARALRRGTAASDNPDQLPLLDCGESGSTLRFLLPVVAALGCGASFTGRGRLAQRPLSPLYEELQAKGIRLSPQGSFPLSVEGALPAGTFRIAGNVSSQYISGLLMAAPLLDGDVCIQVTHPVESRPYIDLTISALARFGVAVEERTLENVTEFHVAADATYTAPDEVQVEGDWSNAAFWLCAGALSQEGICVSGLDAHSAQGDRAVLDVLERFGANIAHTDEGIQVSRGELRGIDIDAHDFPDLVPPLAVVAAQAAGTTRIRGAERLRIKESDRLESTSAVLRALGVDVQVTDDGMDITGRTGFSGGVCHSANDHRICMEAAIAASCATEEVVIHDAHAHAKSYPDFFEDYRALGGTVRIEEV